MDQIAKATGMDKVPDESTKAILKCLKCNKSFGVFTRYDGEEKNDSVVCPECGPLKKGEVKLLGVASVGKTVHVGDIPPRQDTEIESRGGD